MKFCDKRRVFPKKYSKLPNIVFDLSFVEIHYIVTHFDKQYFSFCKLNINKLIKDLCDLIPVSCCSMTASSVHWLHVSSVGSCSWVRAPLKLLTKLLLARVGTRDRGAMSQEGCSQSFLSKDKPLWKQKLGMPKPVSCSL